MADLPSPTNVLLSVVGNLDDPAFHECRLLATAISEEFAPVTLDVRALVETDYQDFLSNHNKTNRRSRLQSQIKPICVLQWVQLCWWGGRVSKVGCGKYTSKLP